MIRQAVVTDAQRIAEITHAGWTNAYVVIVTEESMQEQTVDGFIRYWLTDRAYLPPRYTWVSEVDQRVVGYAHVGDFEWPRGEVDGSGELRALYVDPNCISQGHGRALMAVVLDHFENAGYESACLWVMRDNTRAIRFYETAGWVLDDSILQVSPPKVLYRYRP